MNTQDMQEEILKIFFEKKKIDTQEKQKEFFKNLIPKRDKLFESFKRDHVQVDYSDVDIQFLFVLIYFPFHSEILPTILKDFFSRKIIFLPEKEIKINFIGCGAGAEILGFFNFLELQSIKHSEILINTFDKYSQDWQFWLNSNFEKWISPLQNNIQKNHFSFDLASSDDYQNLKNEFQNSNLVVLQNTLSEIHEDDNRKVVENLVDIFTNLREGGTMLIIDFKYQSIFKLLKLFVNNIFENSEIEIIENKREQEYDGVKIRNSMPDIIKENLFSDKEKKELKRYAKYFYLVIKKHSPDDVKSFTFSKSFMNDHYNKIKNIVDEEGIKIEKAKEIQNALKYTFKDEEQSCAVNFWYKGKGGFSKTNKENGDDELWKRIEELL